MIKLLLSEFKRQLKREYDCFYLTKEYVIFKKPKLTLWNSKTDEEWKFKNVDELLKHQIDGVPIADIIEKLTRSQEPQFEGGRGSSSGSESTFKFGHAEGDGKDETRPLPPALANVKIKSKNFESALQEFRAKHVRSNHEWAYEVDSNGYVHQYVEGNRTSVNISGRAKVPKSERTMIIHNHPGGGAFSDSDLLHTAAVARERGIIASGKKYDYVFEKGDKFKAQSFTRAVKKAEMQGKNYDDAVDKWLRKNQTKYGYKYTRIKRY